MSEKANPGVIRIAREDLAKLLQLPFEVDAVNVDFDATCDSLVLRVRSEIFPKVPASHVLPQGILTYSVDADGKVSIAKIELLSP